MVTCCGKEQVLLLIGDYPVFLLGVMTNSKEISPVTTNEALQAMAAVAGGARRSDEVWVKCASESERDAVVSQARELLRHGFVHRVIAAKHTQDLRVVITFE